MYLAVYFNGICFFLEYFHAYKSHINGDLTEISTHSKFHNNTAPIRWQLHLNLGTNSRTKRHMNLTGKLSSSSVKNFYWGPRFFCYSCYNSESWSFITPKFYNSSFISVVYQHWKIPTTGISFDNYPIKLILSFCFLQHAILFVDPEIRWQPTETSE
jgi:hypothetical protein